MLKGIPIGREDFRDIRENNLYYIDKTKFIEDILLDGTQVKLFCRPRRFGKTLNMSTLKYFFDIKDKEKNRKLFDGLYIENSPLIKEQGKYPVIFISMKGITGLSWKESFSEIKLKVKELFRDYSSLVDKFDKYDKGDFEKYILDIENIGEAELKKSLHMLTKLLYKYYDQKVVVLIDEYDSPIMTAYEKGYYTEMINFFKAFYGDVLKTNEYLHIGVLTGIVRVAQAGIFSDLNNFISYTVLDDNYNQVFGLVEKEVKDILEYYQIGYEMPEVKEWYDGYNFGNVDIYNPWSILNFVKNKKVKSYWVNSSGNAVILNMLLLSDGAVFSSLEDLIKDRDVIIYINESIRMGDNLSPNNIWELMLFSGYLTIKEELDSTTYIVKIPNMEVRKLFKALFVDSVFRGQNNIGNMIQALLSKDVNQVVNIFEEVVINAMSYYDFEEKEAQDSNKNFRLCLNNQSHSKEFHDYWKNPYQTLLGGFLYGLDNYYIMYPNIESGYGRADIVLNPRNKNWAGYILELKRGISSDDKKEADRALNQIAENKYETILKRDGVKEIIKIGLVFDGKKIISSYIK